MKPMKDYSLESKTLSTELAKLDSSNDLIELISSLANQLEQTQAELEESRSLFQMIYGKWEEAMGELSNLKKSQIIQQIQQQDQEQNWLQIRCETLKYTAQQLQTELKQTQIELQQAQSEVNRLQQPSPFSKSLS